jgi:hypothetical protein
MILELLPPPSPAQRGFFLLRLPLQESPTELVHGHALAKVQRCAQAVAGSQDYESA